MKKVLILIMGLCVLLCHTSCKHEKKQEKEESFLVTNPIRKDTIIKKEYVSQIHAIQHIELRAQERGYLEKIYVDEGEHVKKGQLLFQIMPKLYEAEMMKAKAEVNFAEIEYQNTKKLAEQNVVSSNELGMAKAKLAQANAELALKEVHLQFTQIKAPFDGIIDRFHVRLGSLIDEGELLTSLSDNSQMWVYYNVPEAEYLEFNNKITEEHPLKVELKMANSKLFNQPGYVKTIIADFDNETGNIPFRATFPNPDGLLRHGETGTILSTIKHNQALLVPQKATFEVLDKKYVYVITEDNKIKSQEIEIEAELQHLYIVKGGVSANDKILLEGLRLVRENDEITYELENPEKVLAHLDLYAE